MKNLVALITFAMLVCGCGGSSQAEASAAPPESPSVKSVLIPLKNPSFNGDASGVIADWEAHEHNQGNSYTFVSDTMQAYSVPSSARINRYGTEVYGRLDQKMKVESAWINKTVRLTGFLKSTGIDGPGGGLVLQAKTGGGSILVWDHMDGRRVQGAQDWKVYTAEIKIPSDAYFLLVGALLEGGGTLWADDFKLEVLD